MAQAPAPLDLSPHRHIVVLTGAGISVASGLRPFRGAGGLWTEHPEEIEAATGETMARDPMRIWRLLGPMRPVIAAAKPNAAHLALAGLEARAARLGASFLLVTQNVDGLHLRAGSREVVEIHGTLGRSRCMGCAREPFEDWSTYDAAAPRCDRCGGTLRPDVALFNEMLDVAAHRRIERALDACDLFLAIGTSGTIAPASTFVHYAAMNRARTILVNAEPLEPDEPAFRDVYIGKAEELERARRLVLARAPLGRGRRRRARARSERSPLSSSHRREAGVHLRPI